MRAMSFFGGLLMLLGGMVMFAQIRTIADRDKTIEDLKRQLAVKSATVTVWAIGDLKPGTKYYACPEIPGSVSITGNNNAVSTRPDSSVTQDALPGASAAPKE